MPFHTTPLLLVAAFTACLLLAAKAGLVGIPLGLIIISWFFKYCFIVLDAVAAGEDALPVLSVEMVNPLDEQRPLAIAVLVVAECSLALTLGHHAGRAAWWGLVGALLFALPANIGILAIGRHPWQVVSPPALVSLIAAMGRDYLWLLAVMAVAASGVYGMSRYGVPQWMLLALTQLLFLLVFALIGGVIFEHRLELGIEAKTRQERVAERDAREHLARRAHMLDQAYNHFKMGKGESGWQELATWLRAQEGEDERYLEHRAVLEAVCKWEDVRVGDRLANELIGMLLAKKATGEALGVAERRLAGNPVFRVLPLEQAVRLGELAGLAGKKALQRRLAGPP